MAEDYKEKSFFDPLTDDEKRLLEALRNAQLNQGDMSELQEQPYQINLVVDQESSDA